LTLAVELQDAGAQRGAQLVLALAHAGEDHSPRVGARAQHAVQLASRDDVESESLLGEQRQESEVSRRLDCVAGQHVEPAERAAEHARVPQESGRRIHVRRRTHLLGDARERNALAVQLAMAPDEVVQGAPASAAVAEGSPASAASVVSGCGGPFAPQYAVASTTAATSARSIRTEWRR